MFVSNTSALTGAQAGDDFPEQETAGRFFDPLQAHSYDLLVIDPPWPFATWSSAGQAKSASKHYSLMTLAEIMALPVRKSLKDHAVVLLWTTGAMLEQAHEVMRAWGITYKTNLVWRKVTPSGKVRMGCGYWARTMHELRRADLFAREKRKGWDCWGDEVEKFSPASSHAERDTILIGGEQPEQPNRGIGAAGRGATTETTDSRQKGTRHAG